MTKVIKKLATTATFALGAIALSLPANADPAVGQQKYGVNAIQSTSIATNGGWTFPFLKEQHGQ